MIKNNIFNIVWNHLKTNWLKLLPISFLGYFLPLMVIVGVAYYAFTTPINYGEGGGVLVIVAFIIFILILSLVMMIFEGATIFVKAKIRLCCINQILKTNNISKTNFYLGSFLSSEEFIYYGGNILCSFIFRIMIHTQLQFNSGLYPCLVLLATILCAILSFFSMFVPYFMIDKTNFIDSFNLSRKLVWNNLKIVFLSMLICNLINIFLWSTVVGIIVAIPLKILVTTVLYSELTKTTNISSKSVG